MPPLMGQVGSSELKQNYQDRGVKGTIYVSGRGRMMILIYYHAPLDESGFSLHARLKETKSILRDLSISLNGSKINIYIYTHMDENFFCIKILENFTAKRNRKRICVRRHAISISLFTIIDKLIRRRDFRTKRKRHGFLHTDILFPVEKGREAGNQSKVD